MQLKIKCCVIGDGDDNVFDDEGKRLSNKIHLAQGRKRKASSRTNIAKTAKTMLGEWKLNLSYNYIYMYKLYCSFYGL
jgi:hypothetical protein